MKKTQKVKWQGISLPIPFINDIKKHIKDKNEFKNVPAFVIDAVREAIEMDNILARPFSLDKGDFFEESELKAPKVVYQLALDKRLNDLEKKLDQVIKLLTNKKKKVPKNNFRG